MKGRRIVTPVMRPIASEGVDEAQDAVVINPLLLQRGKKGLKLRGPKFGARNSTMFSHRRNGKTR